MLWMRCSPLQTKQQQQKKPIQNFPLVVVVSLALQCCWRIDSVLNVIVEAVKVCAHFFHLHADIKRVNHTYFKLGSLKAIFQLSIELELPLSLMQIKAKLFYFHLKNLEETNLQEVGKLNEQRV